MTEPLRSLDADFPKRVSGRWFKLSSTDVQFIVFGLIWWINPGYVAKFFIDERLMVAGMFGLIWMSIGGFIMAKMVSFEI